MRNEQRNITLADIAAQKVAIQKKLEAQKVKMSEMTHRITAPLKPAAKKSNAFMGAFNTSMAIFDGILIGYKLLRRAKKFLK